MVALRMAKTPAFEDGILIVTERPGGVRALVDANLAKDLPRLRPAIDQIGRVLSGLIHEDMTVSIRFDRGPRAAMWAG